jgi:NADPH:quinone reductase-like Zn-dependent oxidoreductase
VVISEGGDVTAFKQFRSMAREEYMRSKVPRIDCKRFFPSCNFTSTMVKQVFMTGATGYIGGSVLYELIQNHKDKYSVTAMVRSANSAKMVEAIGAKAVIGTYDKPEALVNAVIEYDVNKHPRVLINSILTLLKGIIAYR